VVGCAENGEEAVRAAMSLGPDIITMDVNMPGMDGLEATRAIMSQYPVPIVIVTGKMDPKDSAVIFRIMDAGALTVMAKPFPPGHPEHEGSVRELTKCVKLMAEIKVVRRFSREKTALAQAAPSLATPHREIGIVAIGASAGGPPIINTILSALPRDFRAPIVIVQHMAKGFMTDFINWLNLSSSLPVELANDGCRMSPGRVYVAPDGVEMNVSAGDRIALISPERGESLFPSAASLFASVARVYGRNGVGVLLTGMGKDGAVELKAIRESGGVTIAQNRESSMVFGMPGEAVRIGAAEYILYPNEIIATLTRLVNRGSTEYF